MSAKMEKTLKNCDVTVIPVWNEKKKPQLDRDAKAFASLVKTPLEKGDFFGREGETLLLYPPSDQQERLLLIGLGDKENFRPESLRIAYGQAVKSIRAKRWKSAQFLLPHHSLAAREVICRNVMEGVLLANYSFDILKHDVLKENPNPLIEKIHFASLTKEEEALFKKTKVLVESVNLTRDLVNGNADEVHVDRLIQLAHDLSAQHPQLKITILDKKRLEKEKMGLMLAVGKGAGRPPALIIIEYKADPKSKETIAFVGKGITYDTGGLNLKPTGNMETMKCDMAGAAAVIGTMQAAASLKIKKNLIGVLAVAENAIGPLSYKPGDVYSSHAGTTVEISNTDAEGRLVLADAISYVQEHYAPSQLIDLATLTGGIVIALGEEATGLFCNDEKLAKDLERAGERTHERVWRMPIYPEYKKILKSSIADLKNSGSRQASSSTGAIFIQQFVKKISWAHLDIAGTAYLSETKAYHPTFATGVGVRLLIDFLEHFE